MSFKLIYTKRSLWGHLKKLLPNPPPNFFSTCIVWYLVLNVFGHPWHLFRNKKVLFPPPLKFWKNAEFYLKTPQKLYFVCLYRVVPYIILCYTTNIVLYSFFYIVLYHIIILKNAFGIRLSATYGSHFSKLAQILFLL